MSRTKFHLSTSPDSPVATGSSGKYSLTIDRPKGTIILDRAGRPPPKGLGYSGGDLFMLALAGCFTNDVIGEASRRGLKLNRVDVDIEVDWGAKDACAESIGFSTNVEADASQKDITDLIQWADNDSTISRTVRTGMPFTVSTLATLPASS